MIGAVKKIIVYSVAIAGSIVVLSGAPAFAVSPSTSTTPQSGTSNSGAGANCETNPSIFPRWYDGLCKDGKITQPKPKANTTVGTQEALGGFVAVIALNIVKMLLYIVGYVSLGFIIYGGVKYITSGDNSAGIAAGKKTIINAVIGLIISILSVGIVTFIVGRIA